MSGTMEFVLGLEAGGFAAAMGKAENAVRNFLHAFNITELALKGFEGFEKALNKGAGLEHLSKKTGESVKSLYLLQQGFESAGLSSDQVGSALFHMQKALGGVNEMGERTENIFAKIGLSRTALQHQGAAQQVEAITKALGRLNQSDAAKAASMIFGRSDAAGMIQLARSSGEFAEGMQKAGAGADVFARNAEAFARVERIMTQLKSRAMEAFAGIAEGLEPIIEKVLKVFEKIPFAQIGEDMGRLFELFRSGWANTFDVLPQLALAGLQKIGALLLDVFRKPLIFWQTAITWGIQKLLEFVKQVPGLSQVFAGVPEGFTAEDFGDIFNDLKKNGPLLFDVNLDDIVKSADANWNKALEKFRAATGGKKKPGTDEKAGGGPGSMELDQQTKTYRPDVSEWEKIGFVMSGGGPGLADFARATAQNTQRLIELGESQLEALQNIPMPGVFHQPDGTQ